MLLTLVLISLFICYSILIIYYWRAWQSIPKFVVGSSSNLRVSVIIPARNEAENIGRLLRSLQEQDYPADHFEIIVVDDHSTDDTAAIVKQFANVKLLSLDDDPVNSYKKKAIEEGIAAASHSFVITTDADCVVPKTWLRSLTSCRQQTGAVFIVAPVTYECNGKIVEIFQAMDFMVLQGITGASAHKGVHAMCNGANLGYDREVFYEVGGFSGIDHIASGDDMLLMYKVARKYPGRIRYVKSMEATVTTRPMPDWSSFFNQRIRWASKAMHYEDKNIFIVLLLVYLFNLGLGFLFVAGFWHPTFWLYFLVGWVLKTMVELPFFSAVAIFFNKRWAIRWFLLFQPLHILYTIVSGLFGQFGKYEWKGRRVR